VVSQNPEHPDPSVFLLHFGDATVVKFGTDDGPDSTCFGRDCPDRLLSGWDDVHIFHPRSTSPGGTSKHGNG